MNTAEVAVLKKTILAGMISLMLNQGAQAAFTVMDDDLFPARAIPASVAERAKAVEAVVADNAAAARADKARQAMANEIATADEGESYYILYTKGKIGMDAAAKKLMADLIPMMGQDNIKVIITGRPDQNPNKGLADQRASQLRSYLVQKGIPVAKIESSGNGDANSPVGEQYPLEIKIVAVKPPPPPAVPVDVRIKAQQMAGKHASTTNVAIIATQNSDVRMELIRQITLANLSSQLDSKIASATILQILGATGSKPVEAVPASMGSFQGDGKFVAAPQVAAQPAAPGAEFGLVASTDTQRPKEWILSSEKTLKENTTEWARRENYEMDWKATNYFKIGRNSTLNGGLLEAVDRVTTAAGLKMEVWKKDRLIRISDKASN